MIGDEHSAKHLLAYDPFFVGLTIKPRVISLVERILGSNNERSTNYILNLQNGIVNFPGKDNPASTWHRDLPHQHFVSDPPLAISALHVVDDFNEETGGTIVVPGTHKYSEMPSAEYVKKYSKQILAKAGSVMVFDCMMYHQAGYNRSQGIRRGISHIYQKPLMKQQISLPQVLQGKYSEDPALAKLLGYTTEPAGSVKEYRLERIRRKQKNAKAQEARVTSFEEKSY